MKNNYQFSLSLLIGILFTGFASFGQSVNSLNPQQKKDAAYIQAHQNEINNGVKAEAKHTNTGTSVVSASPQKEKGAVISTEPATSPNYYNPRSFIYTDARTPRYALTGDKAQDIANYNKAKEVWMQNNPQPKTEQVKTAAQLKERNENTK